MQGYIPSMDGLSMSESHLYFVALTSAELGVLYAKHSMSQSVQ